MLTHFHSYPMPETTLCVLRQCLRDEGVIAAGIFGSSIDSTRKVTSDIDLVVVRNIDLPDVRAVDALSRKLKRRLREAGVSCLFAFNIYSRQALGRASEKGLWLIASIARSYLSLFDDDDVIASALSRIRQSTVEIAPFIWRGTTGPPDDAYTTLLQQLHIAATLLRASNDDAAAWYQLEARRVALLQQLRAMGIYASRVSMLDATRLVHGRKFADSVERTRAHRDNFQHIVIGERLWFDYALRAFHAKAAEMFAEASLPLLAVRHAYAAVRCELLRQLHHNSVPMLEGEVVQQWLLRRGGELPESRRNELHEFGMQAEQVLGRAHVASFDLDENGDGVYDLTSPAPVSFYEELLGHLRNCTEWLAAIYTERSDAGPDAGPQVSIVIPTYKRPDRLQRAVASAQAQIMPPGSFEVIVVHDGDVEATASSPSSSAMHAPVTHVTAPHGGAASARMHGVARAQGRYIAFVDDDVVLSPTWMLRVLQTSTSDAPAFVGSTLLSFPPSSFIEAYCDYRELLRRPVTDRDGRIVNIVTACAVIDREVLAGAGPMAPLHQKYRLTGADDVDFTWAVAHSGGTIRYASNAVAFHEHRRRLRDLVAQHVGYGEGAALHCLSRKRDPNELSIPAPTARAVMRDTLTYLMREVPVRVRGVWQSERSLKAAVLIPLLDAVRRMAYNLGMYRGRRFDGAGA